MTAPLRRLNQFQRDSVRIQEIDREAALVDARGDRDRLGTKADSSAGEPMIYRLDVVHNQRQMRRVRERGPGRMRRMDRRHVLDEFEEMAGHARWRAVDGELRYPKAGLGVADQLPRVRIRLLLQIGRASCRERV